jgi:hypothetical protein
MLLRIHEFLPYPDSAQAESKRGTPSGQMRYTCNGLTRGLPDDDGFWAPRFDVDVPDTVNLDPANGLSVQIQLTQEEAAKIPLLKNDRIAVAGWGDEPKTELRTIPTENIRQHARNGAYGFVSKGDWN